MAVEMPMSCYCGQNKTNVVSAAFNKDGILHGVDITFTTQGMFFFYLNTIHYARWER